MDGSAADGDGCLENTGPRRVCAPEATGRGQEWLERGRGCVTVVTYVVGGKEGGRRLRGWISEEMAGWMVPRHVGRWRGMRCGGWMLGASASGRCDGWTERTGEGGGSK